MDDTIHVAEKSGCNLLFLVKTEITIRNNAEVCFMVDFPTLMFWIIAFVLVVAALCVVTLRNIVHSALLLVVVFAATSGIYLLLNAEFIAIVQILIYAGAVTILILFALMLTRISGQPITNPTNKQWWVAVVICTFLGACIVYAATVSPRMIVTDISSRTGLSPDNANNVVAIGKLLYSPTGYSYVLPFEIASLVLLVAIIGAIVIGREE
jgi:NADH:ubiquinone oxidoreductase subunit 6 (subunit J)